MSLGEGAAAQPQAPPATTFVLCTFFFSSQRQDLSSSSHMSTEGTQFPLLAGLEALVQRGLVLQLLGSRALQWPNEKCAGGTGAGNLPGGPGGAGPILHR